MTDYEMYSAFSTSINMVGNNLFHFVIIVSGFLVISYCVAANLKSSMVGILVTLYTLAAGYFMLVVNRESMVAKGISEVIRTAVEENRSSLGWHPLVRDSESFFYGLTLSLTLLMIVAYIGTLVFFFHQRKIGMDNDNDISI